MNYFFRRLKRTDINSVWTLVEILKKEKANMSFAELKGKEELLNYIDNPAELTYVAVSKDKANKVLCLVKGRRDLSKEKSHAVFLSAATHPDSRGTGLAAKLTNFALKEMKNEDITIARIYVYSDNKASINSVKKLDFLHAGSVIRHHKNLDTGEYIDDLIFHKILD